LEEESDGKSYWHRLRNFQLGSSRRGKMVRVIIPSAEGAGVASGKAFPSYVAFTADGQRLVGEPARRQAAINAEGTIQAAKRKMGTDYKFRV
jgi:molecular chaperone DnaK (HSP70)